MQAELSIDKKTGNICIGDVALLQPGQAKGSIESRITALLAGSRDHGNGYEWIYLRGLTFGGQPASLAIGFQDGRLEQASWSVQLVDAPMDDSWSTRKAADSELTFVRKVLSRDMQIRPGTMPWGEVWSYFDAKDSFAANGLRYRRP